MANAYEAGAAGMPCAFFRGYYGSDLAKVNSSIRFVPCPFTGEELACIPAIRPDVTIIHAQKADRDGNVMIEGIVGVQKFERRDPARLGNQRSFSCAQGSSSALRARLLLARQRILYRLGGGIAGTRTVPGLDEGTRDGHGAMNDTT
jgi:hypothetical protein